MGAPDERSLETYDFSWLYIYDEEIHSPLRSEGADEWDLERLPCIEDLLAYSGDIPAFPSLATRALHMLADPEVEITELTKLINSDQAVAAQVLRAANSAAFRGNTEINNIQHAVTRLGLNMVAQILAVAATRSLFDRASKSTLAAYTPLWDRVWLNAITNAFSGLWLAANHLRSNSGDAFAACLLHDVGKTGVLHGVGELVATGRLSAPLEVWLVEFLMEDLHIAMGGELAMTWELPSLLTRSICDHHVREVPREAGAEILHVVRVVSAMTEMRVNPRHRWGLEREARTSAAALDLDTGVLDRLGNVIEQAEERALRLVIPA